MKHEIRRNTVRLKTKIIICSVFDVCLLIVSVFLLYIGVEISEMYLFAFLMTVFLIYPVIFIYSLFWKLIFDVQTGEIELHRFFRKTVHLNISGLNEITLDRKFYYQDRFTPYCRNYIILRFGKIKIRISIGENEDGSNADYGADLFIDYLKQMNVIIYKEHYKNSPPQTFDFHKWDFQK